MVAMLANAISYFLRATCVMDELKSANEKVCFRNYINYVMTCNECCDIVEQFIYV